MSDTLRITEIFHSLQGESDTVGWPTVFVRLTGCPLRCVYCDTAYAFSGGKMMSLDEIMTEVKGYKAQYVTVTGGEPLAQPNAIPLMSKLCDANLSVSIETSGALDISKIDPRVIIVMDLKTPSSKEAHRNLYENIQYLKPSDQIKFIIGDREDYEWMKDCMQRHHLSSKVQLLASPSYGEIELVTLADWLLEDRLPVRFQMQLHKILWGDKPGV